MLFRNRFKKALEYGPPELVRLDPPALIEAARRLDIAILGLGPSLRSG